MTTEKVSIRFTSLTALWAFRLEIQVNHFEMNLKELTINCKCTKEHIDLANEKYNAVVQRLEQETNFNNF